MNHNSYITTCCTQLSIVSNLSKNIENFEGLSFEFEDNVNIF